MYTKGHYARKKIFSSIKNIIWSAVTLTITVILIVVFVHGCNYWYNDFGEAIK